MISIINAHTRSGNEWCTCCGKKTNTKRIAFSQDGSSSISVVLCDNCREELSELLFKADGPIVVRRA